MEIQVPCCYIFSEYMLLGSILCHSISNTVLSVSTEELIRQQTIRCNNYCPFGFQTDVEGRYTCHCHDPCASLKCLQGTKCVITSCAWEFCSPKAICQAETMVHIKPKNGDTPYWKELSQLVQGDDPSLWTGIDVCSQPLPEAAVTCRRKRRRWYYSSMTGKCVRFMGCDTPGNNFGRKQSCKSKCRINILSEEQRKDLENSPQLCHDSFQIPTEAKQCNFKKRRWFYNAKTGQCENFMGCKGSGNFFSRKLFCKTKCINKRRQFKLGSKADSREQTSR